MDANPTLDQLQVFLTVAETGSFSAASRALNRAQSVVSYTIANLEAQLEVTLFERNGVRQPRLTDEGRAIVIYALAPAVSKKNKASIMTSSFCDFCSGCSLLTYARLK